MISIFPNIFHEDMNLVANFISEMSKLFGEVGRVDRRIFVQTYFCPYQGSRQVGQTPFGHMSKISQFFLLDPLLTEYDRFYFYPIKILLEVGELWPKVSKQQNTVIMARWLVRLYSLSRPKFSFFLSKSDLKWLRYSQKETKQLATAILGDLLGIFSLSIFGLVGLN